MGNFTFLASSIVLVTIIIVAIYWRHKKKGEEIRNIEKYTRNTFWAFIFFLALLVIDIFLVFLGFFEALSNQIIICSYSFMLIYLLYRRLQMNQKNK